MSDDKAYTIGQVRGAFAAGRMSKGALVGKQFMLRDEAGFWLGKAGVVVSAEAEGYYLLEFREWILGQLSGDTKLFHVSDLQHATFYETPDECSAQCKRDYEAWKSLHPEKFTR